MPGWKFAANSWNWSQTRQGGSGTREQARGELRLTISGTTTPAVESKQLQRVLVAGGRGWNVQSGFDSARLEGRDCIVELM